MTVFRAVTPRRLTGREEAEVIAAAERLAAAEREVERLIRERDRLILEIVEAGARVTDLANVLGVSRSAIYDSVTRAKLTE